VVTLAAGDRKAVTVRLVPPAGISGRVVDADGDPGAYCAVQVFTRVYQDGRLTMTPVGASVTDDRGEYRVGGLAPGRYYVYLRPRPMPPTRSPLLPRTAARPEATETWPPLFYPGVRDFASAGTVTVEPGVDATGIDFKLQTTGVVSVAGSVTGMPAGPSQALTVTIVQAGSVQGLGSQHPSNVSGGRFRFGGLTPGSYVVRAEGTVGGRSYLATLPVEVGERSIDDFNVVLQRAVDIPGRIRVEGGANPMKNVVLVPRDTTRVMHNAPPRGEVAPDGTFVLPDVVPGTYALAMYEQPLHIKTLTFAGQPSAHYAIEIPPGSAGPIEIVASTKLGQISGLVDGGPGAAVVLMSEGGRELRATQTDANGKFSVDAVRPGKYKAAALGGADPSMPLNAAAIELIEKSGTSITVEEGAQLTLQLRAIPLP
jgi:protocatechuate 3,4-dioxygenase beta subunit